LIESAVKKLNVFCYTFLQNIHNYSFQ
jgi:hypothetical protein